MTADLSVFWRDALEVPEAAFSHYDDKRGLTAWLRCYVMPDDRVYSVRTVDGSDTIYPVLGEHEQTFWAIYGKFVALRRIGGGADTRAGRLPGLQPLGVPQ